MDVRSLRPVCVVLPAAGSGIRHGTELPKQFTLVDNKPLMLFTLQTFHRIPWIDHLIVPVHPRYESLVTELVSKYGLSKVKVIQGMNTRHRSIYAGLKAIPTVCESPNVALIHDVARVFAGEELVKQVAMAADEHGVSDVVCPLASTVVCLDSDGQLEKSLDRNRHRNSEMPQGFKYAILRAAYDKADEEDLDCVTGCLELVRKRIGIQAKLIEGPNSLWKVTFKKDSYAAEGMIKEHLITVNLSPETPPPLSDRLKALCKTRNIQVTQTAPTGTNVATDCNTWLFYRRDNNPDVVEMGTNDLFSKVNQDRLQLFSPCVIHACSELNPSRERLLQFIEVIQKLAKGCKAKEILVFGVYNQTDPSESFDRLAELIMSVLWNRESAQNGQVYLLA